MNTSDLSGDLSSLKGLPRPQRERWQLLRAGLQNVWEYDDQRFVFHHGRLLLRGRNESGKTKALELLLPFLLDADLAPRRLDPFGSASRSMRWNLINEHNPEVQVNIGYVWLELGRQNGDGGKDKEEYYTLGAGLRAKRSTGIVEVWYFTTSQRIDRDLRLQDTQRLLQTKGALGKALGAAGTVYDKQRDYRRCVNQMLFGMSDEQYGALIDTLLQLRRPQLAKQLEPAALSDILTQSLPPLDREVVAPLAEGFERLDHHRSERETLQQTLGALRGFLGVYRRYVRTVAKARAQDLTRADSAYRRARSAEREARQRREEAQARQTQLEAEQERLGGEEANLGERIETLRASDEYKAVQQLDQAEQLARAQAEQAERAAAYQQREGQRLERDEQKVQAAVQAVEEQELRLESARRAASTQAAEAALAAEHTSVDRQVTDGEPRAARGTLASLLRVRRESVDELNVEVQRVREARRAAERSTERRRDAEEHTRAAEEKLDSAREAETEVLEVYAGSVSAWASAAQVLDLDAAQRAQLLDTPVDDMPAFVDRLAGPLRAALEDEISEWSASSRALVAEVDAVRVERDALAAAAHHSPTAPDWRAPRPESRPGAPLYLLCDFGDIDSGSRGRLEAALEAAGLLDAWVTPDGTLLDGDTFDVVLAPAPQTGATLASVLVPVPGHDVSAVAIERALASVGLVQAGQDQDAAATETCSCWVATDGRWRLGALHGTYRKDAPAYVGAAAREQERARRLAELETRLADLTSRQQTLDASLAAARKRRARLDEERRAFPSAGGVLQVRARVSAAAEALAELRRVLEGTLEAETRTQDELRRRLSARDVVATRLALVPWVDALVELRERSNAYSTSAEHMLREADEQNARGHRLRERQEEVEEAHKRSAEAEQDAHRARREADLKQARCVALRDALGATREQLLAALRTAEEGRAAARVGLERNRREKSAADQAVGETGKALEGAVQEGTVADERRRTAEGALKHFARAGLSAVVDVPVEGDPETWTFTEALLAARKLDAATGEAEGTQEAREKAENRVADNHQDLVRRLPPEMRVFARHVQGVLEYSATLNDRPQSLLELVAEIQADVATRERLLGDEEHELFGAFLTGRTHDHLRTRLRAAHELIQNMNTQLHGHQTASGMRLRLRWEPGDEAPPGASQAIDLLLRTQDLVSDADRAALRDFLRQRLDTARVQDGLATLQERMLDVLDYRGWFAFSIEFRGAAGGWKKLTKKAHGAGSGGQKAVMLHLPLFAAAAAFYASARPSAPRLIVLDEAFAGIDRETRARLTGLLAEFDLDFLMTSFEEWGFYEELDGLATYHLTRARGMRGVHTDHFVWDGHEAHEVPA